MKLNDIGRHAITQFLLNHQKQQIGNKDILYAWFEVAENIYNSDVLYPILELDAHYTHDNTKKRLLIESEWMMPLLALET